MKTIPVLLLVSLLLFAAALSPTAAARGLDDEELKSTETKPGADKGFLGSVPEFTVPGGFGIPDFSGSNGWGGGYGAGYGGPGGGYARGGVVRPSVVCSDRGPCYKKHLTCPAKCFTSYAHSGKNYGSGGGGGGCTIDCKKRCVAYC